MNQQGFNEHVVKEVNHSSVQLWSSGEYEDICSVRFKTERGMNLTGGFIVVRNKLSWDNLYDFSILKYNCTQIDLPLLNSSTAEG